MWRRGGRYYYVDKATEFPHGSMGYSFFDVTSQPLSVMWTRGVEHVKWRANSPIRCILPFHVGREKAGAYQSCTPRFSSNPGKRRTYPKGENGAQGMNRSLGRAFPPYQRSDLAELPPMLMI